MVGVHNNTFSAIEIYILEKLQRLITVDLDHFGQLKAGGSLFAMIDASYCSFLPTYIFNLNLSRVNFATHDKNQNVYFQHLFTIVCINNSFVLVIVDSYCS